MKTKQKNLRVFEIESDSLDEIKTYIQNNAAILDALTLSFRGASAERAVAWANQNGFCAFAAPSCLPSHKKTVSKPPQPLSLFDEQTNESAQSQYGDYEVSAVLRDDNTRKTEPQTQNAAKIVINRILRSGEIIDSDGDIVIFGRVNSGAKVISKGCVEVFEEVDGLIECDGDYMILRSIGKGSVVFCNETIKKELLKWDLQRVFFENGAVVARKI